MLAPVALITLSAVCPATAQTTPLVDVPDLPAGYTVGAGSPLTRTNVPASVPTLTRCTWGTSTRVAGPFPVITSSGFVRTPVGSTPDATVQETVWQFESTQPAKALAARLMRTYAAAAKCNPLREPDRTPGGSGPVAAGRFARLPLDDVGDASLAVTYAPPRGAARSQIALFRTGASVGSLTVTDPTVDPAAFAALVRKAAERAG